MRQSLTTFLLLFFTFGHGLIAQSVFPCSNGPLGPVGAPSCQSACITCDMDSGFEDQTIQPTGQTQTISSCILGAPMTLENPRWYGFIAGSQVIDFDIKLLGPTANGEGLEAAIISGCGAPPFKAISCANLGTTGGTLTAFLLTVGQPYLLVIDGINGDIGKYRVDVSFGTTKAPPMGSPGAITGPTHVCPGAVLNYSIAPVANAFTYTWTAPPGSKINGAGNTVVIPANGGDNGTSVSVQFGQVSGVLCVTASNPCSVPQNSCIFQITNEPLPINDLPEVTVCNEELPYIWDQAPNQAVFSSGTFTLTSSPYTSYLGCDSIVRQKVTVLPKKFKNLPLQYLCKDECYYAGGFEYCSSGTFSEILTADNGCDSTVSFTLVKIPVKAAAQVVDTLTCKKTSVILRGNGSSAGNTIFYRWINSSGVTLSNADTVVVTAPGAYSLIVRNIISGHICEDTATVVVAANTTPPLANAGPDRIIDCDEPLIQLQGTGSVGSQYTYNWINLIGGNIVSGGNTLTPTVNAPGTYRLVVTDNINGCTAGNNAKVTATILPPGASAVGGTYSCLIPNVTLQVTTNAANPTYAWSGPNGYNSTEQNPSVGAAGSYTVIVTDNVTGCTNAAIATVVANVGQPGAQAAGGTLNCIVNSVQLSGSTTANNPAFAWTGPGGFTSGVANPTVSASGNYILTVTGDNGCKSTATANVALDNTAPGASLAVSGNLNCNNAAVNLTASSGGVPAALTHSWTLPDNSTVNTAGVPTLSAAAAGNYVVVITDTGNGCTSTANLSVVQSPSLVAQISSAEDVLCFGAETGSASVSASGGNGVYTYLWSNDAITAAVSGLAAGNYSVTITDGEQCTSSATATVSQPGQLTVTASATPESTNGASDGTASSNAAGGTPPYSYLWSNDSITPSIENLAPGFYTVTITDANGCTALETAQVLAGDCGISATISTTSPNCFGEANGTATVNLTGGNGPFTYEWSSNGTDQTENNLAAGNYTVTVTDDNGCTISGQAAVVDPPVLTLAVDNVVNTACANQSNGTATVVAGGGTGNISIAWNTINQTGPTATGLEPGTYTAVATDANGCTTSVSATVQALDTESPVIVNAPVTAPLGNTGSVSLSVQSLGINVSDNCGVSTVTFQPATFNCTQLGPHDVAVTATDGSGNVTVETIVVTVIDNLAPALECPANVVRCFGDDVVQYPAPVAMDNCLGIGGSFNMPSGLASGSEFPEGVTTNTFSYTDANGNVGTCSFQVTILSALTIAPPVIVDDIDNQKIGSIDITVAGSQSPYTYLWLLNGDTLPVTTQDLTNLGAGNYQVIVTDANGCIVASEAYTVKSLVDTKEPDWASGLLIVPNPTSGKLSVIFPQQVDTEVQLTVYDMTGRLVSRQITSAPKRVDFDLSSLPGGMYKMSVVVNDQVIVRKIVVSR